MTPHDRYQRRIDLAGEIKQADELVNECRNDVEAKRKALELAEQALSRQVGLRADKHDEARRLAKEAHDDFMSLVPEEDAEWQQEAERLLRYASANQQANPNCIRDAGEQQANPYAGELYQNGEVRLNAVFDEATYP